jgi:hypothetical protein
LEISADGLEKCSVRKLGPSEVRLKSFSYAPHTYSQLKQKRLSSPGRSYIEVKRESSAPSSECLSRV